MTERSGADDETITLAQEAAEQLFNARGSSSPSVYEPRSLLTGLCLESGGNWFWRLSERVEFCGGQAARSRVSSAIS